MKKLLRKLEERIEELKQEETTGVIRTCDFLSEDTLRARKELLRKLEAKRDRLIGGTTALSCVSENLPPSRVELMDAWNHLYICMLMVTWFCISIVLRREGATAVIYTAGAGFAVVATWFPGLMAIALYSLFDRILSKHHPLYQAPRMLMSCHFKEFKARLEHLSKPGEFAKDISLVLCVVVMFGNIASLIIHPDFICLSVIFGFLFSAGGLLAFAAIFLADSASVIFRKCKLWLSITYDLRQVF